MSVPEFFDEFLALGALATTGAAGDEGDLGVSKLGFQVESARLCGSYHSCFLLSIENVSML